jgi:hypothetical protein
MVVSSLLMVHTHEALCDGPTVWAFALSGVTSDMGRGFRRTLDRVSALANTVYQLAGGVQPMILQAHLVLLRVNAYSGGLWSTY